MNQNGVAVTVPQTNLWRERIIYAFMVATMTVALLLAVIAVARIAFYLPPVQYVSLDTPPTAPLCPGDALPFRNQVIVKSATFLTIYASVMDAHGDRNIPFTTTFIDMRTHPHEAEFDQVLPWTVPRIEPGEYQRVLTVRAHNTSDEPLYLYLPFTVGDRSFCQARPAGLDPVPPPNPPPDP